MSSQYFNRVGDYLLNAVPDVPDIRDLYFEPSLMPLAQRFDEWQGEDYSGSSCRGAIRGWYHNGVCLEADWPYLPSNAGRLTPNRAAKPRETTIGAYYRLRPTIVDYHCALNEAKTLYVSARVHEGWQRPVDGKIQMHDTIIGGHAFALVGYDKTGFWVQNSWGTDWGHEGLALWSYADWQRHVQDAWVVTMAFPTPTIFSGVARVGITPKKEGVVREGPPPVAGRRPLRPPGRRPVSHRREVLV